jgi:hypothetical protein
LKANVVDDETNVEKMMAIADKVERMKEPPQIQKGLNLGFQLMDKILTNV